MSAASLRHRGTLACLLAVALTSTACGGSSSSGAAAKAADTAASTVTSAAATSPSGPTTSTGSSAPPAAGASTSAPLAVTTTKVKATGGGDFCKSIADAVNNPVTPTGGTSLKDEKALIEKSLAQGELALAKAPAAIRPDAVIVLTAVAALFKALEKANYDYTKVDPAALSGLQSPAVVTAEAHLTSYVKNTCGITLGTG